MFKGSLGAIDVFEDQQGFHLVADMAGVKPTDLQIEVEDGILSLKGTRTDRTESTYHRRERYQGEVVRQFRLPDHINLDGIEAKHQDGVVTVMLPKSPALCKRSIQLS